MFGSDCRGDRSAVSVWYRLQGRQTAVRAVRGLAELGAWCRPGLESGVSTNDRRSVNRSQLDSAVITARRRVRVSENALRPCYLLLSTLSVFICRNCPGRLCLSASCFMSGVSVPLRIAESVRVFRPITCSCSCIVRPVGEAGLNVASLTPHVTNSNL